MGTERPPSRPGLDPFAPRDPAPLAAFRIAFGALMAALAARYFLNGWIEEQFYRPTVFFPWPGLEWIRPWPRPWMEVHFAALGVLGLFIAAGFRTRLSAAAFGAGFTWVHLIDRANYLNHYYLISLLSGVLAVVPAGSRGPGGIRPVPAWALWLPRFLVCVVYFFAGLAKLQADWLFRAQPLRLWLAQQAELPLVGPLLQGVGIAFLFSWGGALFDLGIPFLLLARRSRPWALGTLAAFHAATAVLFPIGLFPWVMIAASLCFLPPEWVRPRGGPPVAALTAPPPARRRLVLALLGAFAAVQLAVPLRFLLHPGDVLWSEQGFRFSWRVMLVEKTALARFTAVDPDRGEAWEVPPESLLTPVQARQMRTQPDLIRAFARALRRAEEARGRRRVAVHADVRVSLNGASSRPLVDPRCDLAAEGLEDGWILPLDGSLGRAPPGEGR
jgi:hypothetical protein